MAAEERILARRAFDRSFLQKGGVEPVPVAAHESLGAAPNGGVIASRSRSGGLAAAARGWNVPGVLAQDPAREEEQRGVRSAVCGVSRELGQHQVQGLADAVAQAERDVGDGVRTRERGQVVAVQEAQGKVPREGGGCAYE